MNYETHERTWSNVGGEKVTYNIDLKISWFKNSG